MTPAMSYSPAATHRAHARVGTLLNEKWRIDSLLGVGGMAAVYGASHRNGKRAALKMLHAELTADPSLVTRFLREGYLANKVEHPGVVSVLDDAVTEDGSPYLVMELLDGYSLERHTQSPERAMPLRQVLKITDELLDVLAAAHAKGIVHRDIKPANIFLTRDGKVKVLDFGIARLAEPTGDAALTQTGSAIGTPAYMPPEQARGRWADVDARTDLWAVGATMLALLLGHRPRRADTVQEELLMAMTQPMLPTSVFFPHAPERVARAIDCAVAFERERRFPDAHAMQLELRRATDATVDDVFLDRTLVVGPGADTAPVMHPGTQLSPSPSTHPPNAQFRHPSSPSSPITSPSHGSGSYGSTRHLGEPQLTTNRPLWAPQPSAPSPARGAGGGGAVVAAVLVVLAALGAGGALFWKRHHAPADQVAEPRSQATATDPVSPTSAGAVDPSAAVVALDASAPTPVAVASGAPSASASASATSTSSSAHAAGPRASAAPRGSSAPHPAAAPSDTSGFFDRRF
jgi:serine/threonine-protein kinase